MLVYLAGHYTVGLANLALKICGKHRTATIIASKFFPHDEFQGKLVGI
jgi:hypothetical protein